MNFSRFRAIRKHSRKFLHQVTFPEILLPELSIIQTVVNFFIFLTKQKIPKKKKKEYYNGSWLALLLLFYLRKKIYFFKFLRFPAKQIPLTITTWEVRIPCVENLTVLLYIYISASRQGFYNIYHDLHYFIYSVSHCGESYNSSRGDDRRPS